MANDENIKYIVRIANTDLDGRKRIEIAITKIKGIGRMFGNAVCKSIGIDISKKTGLLSDAEIKKLNEVLSDPEKFDIPMWMYNRKKDPEMGIDRHIVGADLKYIQGTDIQNLRKSKSYIGVRHSWGLTVRGQRTKSNFRKNKKKVQSIKRKVTKR